LRKNLKIGDWRLERVRLQATPNIAFKDFTARPEAVPCKTPALRVLPQPMEALRHPKSGALVLSGWVSSWT
jgi:hypothetical protein